MPSKSKSRKQSRALVKRRKQSSRRMRGGDAECDMIFEKRIEAELDHLACLFDLIAKDEYLSILFGLQLISTDIGLQAAEVAAYRLSVNSMMPKATIEELSNEINIHAPNAPKGTLLLTNANRNKNGKPMMGGETPEERAARLAAETRARANAEQAALAERMRINTTRSTLQSMLNMGNRESSRGAKLSVIGGVGGAIGAFVLAPVGAAVGGTMLALSMVGAGLSVSAFSYRNWREVQAASSARNTGINILLTLLNQGSSDATAVRAIQALKETEIRRINAAVEQARIENKTIEECTKLVTTMVTTITKTTVESGEKVLVKGFEESGKVLVAVGNNLQTVATTTVQSTEKVLVAVAPGVNKLCDGGSHLLTKGGDTLEQLGKDAGTFANNFSKPLGDASGKVIEAIPTGMGNLLTAAKEGVSAVHQDARNLASVARTDLAPALGQGISRLYGNITTASGQAIRTTYTDATTAAGNVGRTAASTLASALNRRRQGPQGNGSGSGDPTSMKGSNL